MTELGNRLKEARERKGLSLEDLQTITKIQKRYLIGIEEGNYAAMPGKFYVRAFIKQYAEAVDLNPEEIFDLYKEDIPSVINTELPELSRVKARENISNGNFRVFDILPKIFLAIFIIGAAVLIYYILNFYADDKAEEQVKTGNNPVYVNNDKIDKKEKTISKEETKKDESEVDSTDEDLEKVDEITTPIQEVSVISTSGSDTVYELKNTDRFDLKLVSTGATWVDMKNGKGLSLFTGTLKKGETESQTVDYSKESEAVLIIGRSIDTEIYINDQKIEYAIPPTDQVKQDIVIRFIPKAE